MILKKPKKVKRSRYSSNSAYIRGVFNANKELIVEKIREWEEEGNDIGIPGDTPYQKFRTFVRGYMRQGYSIEKSIRSVGLSFPFATKAERYKQFVFEYLKDYPEEYKKFRELSKEHGRYTKFKENELRYVGGNTYIYADKVKISFKNSPERVEIEDYGAL